MPSFQQEALEQDASGVLNKKNRSRKQVDPEKVIEINSGTSSSYISSDSSELDESTLSLIRKITKTPQKATKSVPQKIDLVNQQPPQPSLQIQITPEPSSTQSPQQTQTPTPTQTHTSPLQMIIPEYVVEKVAVESVQVTESEPSVSITVSEPTQKPPLTTNDQPSSSSSPSIQIL